MDERIICTEQGIYYDGRQISSVKSLKELSSEYTLSGWVHNMEGELCGKTFRFPVMAAERHQPSTWLERELGPAAAGFDEKDSPILLAAIDAMSRPDHKHTAIDANGYHIEERGVFQRGRQLSDFKVLAARQMEAQTYKDGLPTRRIEITTQQGSGTSNISVISHADLVSGMAAMRIDGRVFDNIGFTIFVRSILDKRPA